MHRIDNEPLLNQALEITGAAQRLLDKLDRDVNRNTPEKAKTYDAIKFIIETQSLAIRKLVEHTVEMNDQLSKIIENHLSNTE